jgi:hypothetical protein
VNALTDLLLYSRKKLDKAESDVSTSTDKIKTEIATTMDLLLYARKQVEDANAKSAKTTENLKKEVTTLMELL